MKEEGQRKMNTLTVVVSIGSTARGDAKIKRDSGGSLIKSKSCVSRSLEIADDAPRSAYPGFVFVEDEIFDAVEIDRLG